MKIRLLLSVPPGERVLIRARSNLQQIRCKRKSCSCPFMHSGNLPEVERWSRIVALQNKGYVVALRLHMRIRIKRLLGEARTQSRCDSCYPQALSLYWRLMMN